MKKQVGALLVAGAVLFGGSVLPAFASGTTTIEDGRNGNGIATGTILGVNSSEGTLFVGDTLTLTAGDIVIDGDLSTLRWEGLGSFELTTPGTHTFTVTASTYFKNGKKAGLVHSTTAPYVVTVEVKERPQAEVVTVASTELVDYTYKPVVNNGGKVQFDLTATAKIVFSDGHEEAVTRDFNNVQPTQTLSFEVLYKEVKHTGTVKAPSYN